MKKLIIALLLASMTCGVMPAIAQNKASAKVEIGYFHAERRCMTCNNVEKVSKQAVEKLYPEQHKNGLISYVAVNLDKQESKAIMEKFGATGQALIIISGNQRVDLTSQGFMYANTQPRRLEDAMKKAIDPMLAAQ